jgi:hypothetical protein
MIDDPLSLLSLGIWLMAAGMWPVGFLFGACSACCDEECPEECSKCGHAYDGTESWGPCTTPSEWTLQVSEGNEVSGTVEPFEYNNSLLNQFSLSDAPFSCESSNNVQLNWQLYVRNLFISVGSPPDECGCICCQYGFNPEITITSQVGDPEIILTEVEFGVGWPAMCGCDETFLTATVNLSNIPEPFSDYFLSFPVTCQQELIDWWNSLTITFTLTKEPCECGACCSGDGSCDETPEFYCEDDENWYLNKPAGTWQGVGTDCDPNPCPQLGACCDGDECYESLEAACGGVFQGEGTSCDPNPCDE